MNNNTVSFFKSVTQKLVHITKKSYDLFPLCTVQSLVVFLGWNSAILFIFRCLTKQLNLKETSRIDLFANRIVKTTSISVSTVAKLL